MPRVASLYLPNLAVDRLRRLDEAQPPEPFPEGEGKGGRAAMSSPGFLPQREEGWWPAARIPENTKERAKLAALRERMAQEEGAVPEPGTRIEDCSCPRGGGWRPGARWAKREEVQAQIDALPPHQRPPIRELGRRSEAAEVPFRRRQA